MTTVKFLHKFLLANSEAWPVENWHKLGLFYDNMCHLCALKQARLPISWLESPFDQSFLSVTKMIDSFHLVNHKQASCHILYNPSIIEGKYPGQHFNSQSAEQVFSWLKNFGNQLYWMPKERQNFYIHILVKTHNEWLTTYHLRGKNPYEGMHKTKDGTIAVP